MTHGAGALRGFRAAGYGARLLRSAQAAVPFGWPAAAWPAYPTCPSTVRSESTSRSAITGWEPGRDELGDLVLAPGERIVGPDRLLQLAHQLARAPEVARHIEPAGLRRGLPGEDERAALSPGAARLRSASAQSSLARPTNGLAPIFVLTVTAVA